MKMLHVNHIKSLGDLEGSAATKDTFAVTSSLEKLVKKQLLQINLLHEFLRTGIALIQCLQALSDTSKKRRGDRMGETDVHKLHN